MLAILLLFGTIVCLVHVMVDRSREPDTFGRSVIASLTHRPNVATQHEG
jgi:hypothetical protein